MGADDFDRRLLSDELALGNYVKTTPIEGANAHRSQLGYGSARESDQFLILRGRCRDITIRSLRVAAQNQAIEGGHLG